MLTAIELIKRIVHEQELVIGPLALREAKKVKGISVAKNGDLTFVGDAKKVIGDLVKQYEGIFGPASLEVCREAVKSLLPQVSPEEVPDVLR